MQVKRDGKGDEKNLWKKRKEKPKGKNYAQHFFPAHSH